VLWPQQKPGSAMAVH